MMTLRKMINGQKNNNFIRLRTNIGEGNNNDIYSGEVLEDFIYKE